MGSKMREMIIAPIYANLPSDLQVSAEATLQQSLQETTRPPHCLVLFLILVFRDCAGENLRADATRRP